VPASGFPDSLVQGIAGAGPADDDRRVEFIIEHPNDPRVLAVLMDLGINPASTQAIAARLDLSESAALLALESLVAQGVATFVREVRTTLDLNGNPRQANVEGWNVADSIKASAYLDYAAVLADLDRAAAVTIAPRCARPALGPR
jgi:hypothetical protein